MIADLELEGCCSWASQTQEATQAFSDGGASDGEDENSNIPLQLRAWGRLVPMLKGLEPVDLMNNQLEYVFGRGSKVDVIFKNVHISSTHCKIYTSLAGPDDPKHARRVIIEDLGSANGTFLNGTQLQKNKPQELFSGDIISFLKAYSGEKKARTPQEANPLKEKPKSIPAYLFTQFTSRKGLNGQADVYGVESEYDIMEVLGAGTFAQVCRAIHRPTGQEYAVKIIKRNQFSLLPNYSESDVLHEIEMLRKLDHPNIIKLRNFFKTDQAIYIVTDLMRGGELFDRIVDGGAYKEGPAKKLVARIIEGVAYLHGQGVAHRDLKPENILFPSRVDDTFPKIADFGIAKEASTFKTFCGSPMYFAPEVLRRKDTVYERGSYSVSADMWSLGVIVYIILSGRPPFEDAYFDEASGGTRYSFEYPEWFHVSEEAKDFIRRLLALDPKKRMTAEETLKHSWLRDTVEQLRVPNNTGPRPQPLKVQSALQPSPSVEKVARLSRDLLSSSLACQSDGTPTPKASEEAAGGKRSRNQSIAESTGTATRSSTANSVDDETAEPSSKRPNSNREL